MTKKEFKNRVSIHIYGKGSSRRVRLFYDWKEDINGDDSEGEDGFPYRGYKYMLLGYGVTKKEITDDAYEILINDNIESLWNYDMKVAKTNSERFKVPVVG